MQKPHLDELVDGLRGGPGLLPFLRHRFGSLFLITLGHFATMGVIWI